MFRRIRIQGNHSLLSQKIIWTMGLIFVYMLGRSIPIATAPLNVGLIREAEVQHFLTVLASVTGGQLSSLTLFSLGLSPWMTAMILWRFLLLFDRVKQLTKERQHFYQMLLTFLIAFLQGFGLTASMAFHVFPEWGDKSVVIIRWMTIMVMIAGAFVLTWLGNLNSKKGLGGATVIIIVNMILVFFTNIRQYVAENQLTALEWASQIGLLLASLSILVWLTVVLYRAEYRIPIRRMGLVSRYRYRAYLPIRITPAGGMPFMYAMTLMMLPPILVAGLLNLFPEQAILIYLSQNLSLTSGVGVGVYLCLLYLLSIGFAYYNYDIADITKTMQENGDYIERIRPGRETARYLKRKLHLLTQIGALSTAFIGSAPLLVLVLTGQTEKASLALLVSNVFIVASLLLGIVEQVEMLRSWKKYGPVL